MRNDIIQKTSNMRDERLSLIKKHLVISPSFISEIILDAMLSQECDLSHLKTLRIKATQFPSIDCFLQLLNKCPLLESLDLNFSSLQRNFKKNLNPDHANVNVFPDFVSNMGLDATFIHEVLNKKEHYGEKVSRVVEYCDLHDHLLQTNSLRLSNLKTIYYSPHPSNYFYDFSSMRSSSNHLLDLPIVRPSFYSEHNIENYNF